MANRRYYGGTGDPYDRRGRGVGTGRFKLMLIVGLLMAGFQAVKYFSNTQTNPITGEEQRVQWTIEEETALGIQSAPRMAQQHGGLHPDARARQYVKDIGNKLVRNSVASKSGYQYDFHLLRDNRVVNAFALPGGQIFITAALFERLKTEDQLAGVLGHEIGHVIHRHGAERMGQPRIYPRINTVRTYRVRRIPIHGTNSQYSRPIFKHEIWARPGVGIR